MRFEFGFQSSLLLIFFVHLLVFSGLFFLRYRNRQQVSNGWLGLFLLLAALYIAPWMLGFAGWYDHQPYRDVLFYIPFQHLFWIGPVLFFYVQSLLNPSFRPKRKQWLHFVPGLLYALYVLIVWVYDQCIVHDYYFLANGEDPDFDTWYQWTGFLSMTGYFLASFIYYRKYRQVIVLLVSNAADYSFHWVRNFLLAFLSMLLARLVMAGYDWMVGGDYASSWWYFFSFAISAYYISIAGYTNAVQSRVLFRTALFGQANEVFILPERPVYALPFQPEQYESIPEAEAAAEPDAALADWKARIVRLFETERLYEEPELTLQDVAQQLQTNISVLSRLVNRSFGMNFNDLVNSYRVKRVIELMEKGEHQTQTLLALAFDAGFNSKTTFNRAFKKQTGLSPKEYLQERI